MYDPLRADAYVEHLSEVNNVKDVIAHEDICNDQGLPLVKKGQKITKVMVERIVQFKLVKPIEASINISDALTAGRLHEATHAVLRKIQGIQDSGLLEEANTWLEPLCRGYERYTTLVQKLTVMSIQMPREFGKTVFVSWLCVQIGRMLKFEQEELRSLYLAALAHDIGMLHIPRDYLEKTTPLSAEEWRAIQSHAVIGQKIVEQIPQMPSAVAKAVLEHHECRDGTGYPLGKSGRTLDTLGQIVAMADMVVGIYNNRLEPAGRGVRDLLPILQMNSEKHGYEVYSAIIRTIRQLNLSDLPTVEPESMLTLMDGLLERNARLSMAYRLAEEVILNVCRDAPPSAHLQVAKEVLARMSSVVRGSGILDDGYLRWLQQVRTEKLQFAYREVEDVYLMMEEILWQIGQVRKALSALIEKGGLVEPALSEVKTAVEQLQKLMR